MNTYTEDMTVRDLVSVLRHHRVPLEQYGKGNAKTLEQLLKEIHAKECLLFTDRRGVLVRSVRCACVTITFTALDSMILRLTEDHQEFLDGRVRTRRQGVFAAASVVEKMRSAETPIKTALRAIREELGIEYGEDMGHLEGPRHQIVGPQESMSYPGIKSIYELFEFSWEMSAEVFRPQGYTEVQKDKITHFLWTPS